MPKKFAQEIHVDAEGKRSIANDWYNAALPENVFLGEMAYPDTSYSFVTFHSKEKDGFSLGYASGNYGHSIFMAGKKGIIKVGQFCVLECTNIISNISISIGDHCMFSWGSVITDSWIDKDSKPIEIRRKMLEAAASSANRYLDFFCPKPVVIEDNVWVGFDAVIMPGVRLGKSCIVGCKTIITEDVPAYAVVAGNPARIIKYLTPDDSEEAKQIALETLVKPY